MANWKKVIVSGSNAELNSLSVTNDTSITGSLTVSGSVSLKSLTSYSASYIVGYDPVTGNLYYEGTGSLVAATASYAESASQAVSASYTHTASYVNTLNQDVIISGSLTVTNSVKGTGSLILQPNQSDLRFLEVYNTSPTDTHITASGGQIFLGNDVTYVKVDNYGTVKRIDIVADNGVNISSSLNVTGSTNISGGLYIDEIYPNAPGLFNRIFTNTSPANSGYGPTGSTVIYTSITPIVLNAGAGTEAVQVTGSLSVSNGASGSFSGSFVGNGSGLTNVVASNAFALSQSSGITAFNYDGNSSAVVELSGSLYLSSGSLTLWTGNALANSSISENFGQVLINNAGGVTIQQGGLYVTGAATFHDNVVMQGDLLVQGTTSFQNTQNLAIADQFILLNSGSATFQDSGFVINTGNSGNSGSAFFLETSNTTSGTTSQNGRFAVAGNVQPNATTVTAEEYANTTLITGSAPTISSIPQFGGNILGHGNMWVDSNSGDIYIYA
jgi:hypothetical protein